MELKKILSLLAPDMQRVDELIRARLDSEVALIREIAHYIVHAGGKRMRPALVLLSARALAQEIEAELPDGRSAHVVVNRLASRVFGPAPSLADAEKALGRKVLGGITSDWEAAACSVNLGGPIRHHRPRSKIVKDVTALIGRLASEARRGQPSGLRIAG